MIWWSESSGVLYSIWSHSISLLTNIYPSKQYQYINSVRSSMMNWFGFWNRFQPHTSPSKKEVYGCPYHSPSKRPGQPIKVRCYPKKARNHSILFTYPRTMKYTRTCDHHKEQSTLQPPPSVYLCLTHSSLISVVQLGYQQPGPVSLQPCSCWLCREFLLPRIFIKT